MDEWIAIALWISTLILFQIRKIVQCVWVLTFHSVLLSFIVMIMWIKTDAIHLLIVAIFTFVVKAVAIPLVLYYTIKKTGVHRKVERLMSKYTSFLIAVVLSILGFHITSHFPLPRMIQNEMYLSVSLILIFLGTFIMIDHKKVIMQGVGLITIENGLFLISESVCQGMPLVVELGIFFDVFVTVVVVGVLSARIYAIYGSLNTEKLQKLKG